MVTRKNLRTTRGVINRQIKVGNLRVPLYLGVIVFAFISLIVILSIKMSVRGEELASLEREEIDLIKENKDLSAKLASEISLTSINEKVLTLGFLKPEKTIYVSRADAVAKLP